MRKMCHAELCQSETNCGTTTFRSFLKKIEIVQNCSKVFLGEKPDFSFFTKTIQKNLRGKTFWLLLRFLFGTVGYNFDGRESGKDWKVQLL